MSLLLVGNFLSGVGINRSVCEDLASKLEDAGHVVLTTSSIKGRVPRMADILLSIVRHRRHFDLAIVDVYSGLAFRWAEAACWLIRRLGKPLVLSLHGGNLPSFARKYPRRVSRLLTNADFVTAPSRFLIEELSHIRREIRLVPNPLQLDCYTYRVRRQPEPRLVWLRAFSRIYNPELAIRTLAALRPSFPNITLTMVGPDKGDQSLQRTRDLARQLDVLDGVHFREGVAKAKVPEILASGDIFLNTTDVDNTPVSVMEALATGMCVVSTRVGGVPYLIKHEINGLLTPAGDSNAMADAVRRILAEPLLAERLSQEGRQSVAHLDWANLVPEWERLLGNVLASNQSAARVAALE